MSPLRRLTNQPQKKMSPQIKSLLFSFGFTILCFILYFALRIEPKPVEQFNIKRFVDSVDAQVRLRDAKIIGLEKEKQIHLKAIDSLEDIKIKVINHYNTAYEKIISLPYHPSADAMRLLFSKSGVDTTR